MIVAGPYGLTAIGAIEVLILKFFPTSIEIKCATKKRVNRIPYGVKNRIDMFYGCAYSLNTLDPIPTVSEK